MICDTSFNFISCIEKKKRDWQFAKWFMFACEKTNFHASGNNIIYSFLFNSLSPSIYCANKCFFFFKSKAKHWNWTLNLKRKVNFPLFCLWCLLGMWWANCVWAYVNYMLWLLPVIIFFIWLGVAVITAVDCRAHRVLPLLLQSECQSRKAFFSIWHKLYCKFICYFVVICAFLCHVFCVNGDCVY